METGPVTGGPDSITSRVATSVTSALEASGMKVLHLSDATGIPRTTLIRRLRGHSSFTVAELAAIAEALDLDVTVLVAGDAA